MTRRQSPGVAPIVERRLPFEDVARATDKGGRGPKGAPSLKDLGPPPPGGISADPRNVTGVTSATRAPTKKRRLAQAPGIQPPFGRLPTG